MKLNSTILALSTLALVATSAWSAEFTKGVVKKIDPKAKKVTVSHEELKKFRHARNDHGVPDSHRGDARVPERGADH